MAGQYIEPMPRPAAARLRLPSQCEVCRQWAQAALCGDCSSRYAAPVARCARCGLRLGLPAPACGACLREPPRHERTVAVADYAFPWDRLITDFKFHGRVELAWPLAECLLRAAQAAAMPRPQLVLPVPLGPQRLAERGYNQAWELARRVGAALALPALPGLLLRPVDGGRQAELGRLERQRNLRAAFMVDPRQRGRLQGCRVALVDDVMTTGATVGEATATLLRAGAAAVDVWVLARTADA
jgi:ComF family protein